MTDFYDNELCNLVVIQNQRGLHARAAAKFVRTAESFQAEISVARDDVRASGLSIMGLMMLAATQGTSLKLCARGPDAEEALLALADLIKRRFDEE